MKNSKVEDIVLAVGINLQLYLSKLLKVNQVNFYYSVIVFKVKESTQ